MVFCCLHHEPRLGEGLSLAIKRARQRDQTVQCGYIFQAFNFLNGHREAQNSSLEYVMKSRQNIQVYFKILKL